MSGIRPTYSTDGPRTYTVAEAVSGGQLVEARANSVVGVAAAGSTAVLGVAEIDATNAAPDLTNAARLGDEVTVGFGRFVVTYAADATFGEALKAAAAGQVTPWVSGTDAADLIVGFCDEPAGVTSGTTGLAYISR